MEMNRVFITLALLLGIAFSAVPTVAASRSFTASLTCTGTTIGIIGVVFAYWNWTSNGVPIGPFVQSGIISASGVLHCNNSGGGFTTTTSGTQPSNANGIIATLTSHIKACFHGAQASQSFPPGQPVSITVRVSCTGNAYGTPVTIKGTFTLNS